MDLSLNFAPAPAASTSSAGRGPVGKSTGGRWTDRMKAAQQARKQSKPRNTGSSSGSGSKSHAAQASSKAPRPASASSKQAAQSSTTSTKVANTEIPIELKKSRRPGAGKSDRSAVRREHADGGDVEHDGAGSAAAPASAPSGKKQVISSLFSNLQKVTPKAAPAREDVSASTAVLTPSNAPSMADNFDDLAIRPELVAHLKGKMALSHPTTIQKLAVPFLCDPSSSKKDALLQAQTGSGKTLSYLLPIIQDLCRLSERFAQSGKPIDRQVGTMAIVLVPTRELANQIFEVACKLLSFPSQEGNSHRWITPGLLTGGAHRAHEKAKLRKGIPLLIATPGRLLDHLEATKAFRIAGEFARRTNDSERKKPAGTAGSDDEFAYEDQPDGSAPANGNDDDDYVSSDEDFENMAASRSHRSVAAAQARNKKPAQVPEDPAFALRWLVLDEADRLMDMGFEPQISSIVKLLDARLCRRKTIIERISNRGAVTSRLSGKVTPTLQIANRRTVLCSATVEENVQKLAGIALRDPLLIKGNEATSDVKTESQNGVDRPAKYAPPSQLAQYYCVVPPKLRFVSLISLLRYNVISTAGQGKKQRILVFMSCTDAVDFAWLAFGGLKMGRNSSESSAKKGKDEEEVTGKLSSRSSLLPQTACYRLHGSLDLQTRLSSLKEFADPKADSAVLFCTSVAARGLDVDNVSCVLQYDLPTEGGVNEYIHRVGRTARAGHQGQAWAFLSPNEVGWVDWATASMSEQGKGAAAAQLVMKDVDEVLRLGFGGGDQREYETRATDVQMAYERWVAADDANVNLAKKAFSSHVRAYATHPSNEKQFFHVKSLHLGHLAKAFGLREAPAGIGGGGVKPKDKHGAGSQQTKKRKGDPLDKPAENEKPRHPDRPLIPRSGRALEGKGLRGPRANVRSDFNIASTDTLENMVNKKRRK